MNTPGIQWLYTELPRLVAAGVLTQDTADALRRHYGELPAAPRRVNVAVIISGILGAALIGLGIVLLLAHNWEQLDRPARTVVAFLPLVLGQLVAAWTILRRRGSIAWQEGTASFLVSGVGASIALVGQTYHIPGSIESFLLTWMLLSLPLAYLLDSTLVAILYLIALLFWLPMDRFGNDNGLAFYPLAVLIAPYIAFSFYRRPTGPRSYLLALVASIAFAIGLGFSLADYPLEIIGLPLFAALGAVYYLAHARRLENLPGEWTGAVRNVGAIGLVILALIFTYAEPWRETIQDFQLRPAQDEFLAAALGFAVLLALYAAAAYLMWKAVVARRYLKLVAGSLPLLAILCLAYALLTQDHRIPMILFNLYLLAFGIAGIAIGAQEQRLGIVNWGILVLSALVIARFFDENISFMIRGLGFILIGIAFLATNIYWMTRRQSSKEKRT